MLYYIEIIDKYKHKRNIMADNTHSDHYGGKAKGDVPGRLPDSHSALHTPNVIPSLTIAYEYTSDEERELNERE